MNFITSSSFMFLGLLLATSVLDQRLACAASASIGFQLGAQLKTVILIFLEAQELKKFQSSSGWEAGVDGSVAVVEFGAGKDINTINIEDPIAGFVFSNKGLMYNLTLEGSKITRLDK